MYGFIVHGAAAHHGVMQQKISRNFQENSQYGPQGCDTCLACVVFRWGLALWGHLDGWWSTGTMPALCFKMCGPIHCASTWPEKTNIWLNFQIWHGWLIPSHCCRPMVAHNQCGGHLGGCGIAQAPAMMVWDGFPHGASPHNHIWLQNAHTCMLDT